MGEKIKIKIVISCVNFNEGGPLSITYDCLRSEIFRNNDLEIIIFVHKKELYKEFEYYSNYKFLEFPEIKSSWFKRIKFEFFESKKLSIQFKPDLWISLHDITPNIICKNQVVYCHNPSPFYRTNLKDILLDHKFFLFSLFYKYLYRINIKKNKFVIVQQNWLKRKFEILYKVPTIVAYPSLNLKNQFLKGVAIKKNDCFTFFYPAFPRIFKNFEVIFKAIETLLLTRSDFELLLTLDASQNKYANKLVKRYGNLKQIKFIGKQSRDQVYEIYKNCNALIFPSKLETWGLPLTEAMTFNLPILAADLEYARENIQDYHSVKFFNPDNFKDLAAYMSQLMNNKLLFDQNQVKEPEQPFFKEWNSLIKFIIEKTKI